MKVRILIIIFACLFSNKIFAHSLTKELNVTLQSSRITLDPGGVQDSQSMLVSHQINCELFTTDSSRIIYDVAESIKYLSSVEIMIRIRPTSLFHDNSPITADDVITSLDYIKNSKTVFNSFFSSIRSIQKIDDHTIVFILTKESPQFLKILSSSMYPIFKKEFIVKAVKNKKFWDFPLGCGKYKISEFGNNLIKIVPIRGSGLPINFHIIKENQISSKEMEKFDIITVNVIGNYKKNSNFNEVEIFHPKQFYIGLNINSKKWSNKEDRCAFLTQLDFSNLENSFGSEIIKATDLLPKGTFGYSDEGQYLFKLKENAKTALIKKNINSFCVSYLTLSLQEKYKKDTIEAIKTIYPNINEKGIKNVKDFGKKFLEYNCDAILFSLVSNYYDGYEFLTIFENNSANFSGMIDKNLFKKIKKSQETISPQKRFLIYREIIDIIADYCVIRPILTFTFKKILIRKSLKAPGIGLSPIYQYYFGDIIEKI